VSSRVSKNRELGRVIDLSHVITGWKFVLVLRKRSERHFGNCFIADWLSYNLNFNFLAVLQKSLNQLNRFAVSLIVGEKKVKRVGKKQ